jgi:hypothetical protein
LNNNYGREAAAFLKATNNSNNYRSGRLFEGKIMVFFGDLGTATTATVGNNNYGREAVTFLKAK